MDEMRADAEAWQTFGEDCEGGSGRGDAVVTGSGRPAGVLSGNPAPVQPPPQADDHADVSDEDTRLVPSRLDTPPAQPGSAPFERPRKGFQARLAEGRDREAAKAILRQQHAKTVFRAQAFSDTRVDRMLDKVLSRPDGMAGIVAEYEGEVTGIAWATIGDYLLTEDTPFVTVHLIAVDLTLRPFRRAKAFLTL
jgi:hypothetical protein